MTRHLGTVEKLCPKYLHTVTDEWIRIVAHSDQVT